MKIKFQKNAVVNGKEIKREASIELTLEEAREFLTVTEAIAAAQKLWKKEEKEE